MSPDTIIIYLSIYTPGTHTLSIYLPLTRPLNVVLLTHSPPLTHAANLLYLPISTYTPQTLLSAPSPQGRGILLGAEDTSSYMTSSLLIYDNLPSHI